MPRKLIKKWVDILTGLSLFALFIAISVNAVEIALRFAIDNSFYWIQDVTLLLMMWFVFPGIVKLVYINQDIIIDLLISHFKPAVRRSIDICSCLILLGFLFFLTQQTWYLFVYRFGMNMAIIVCTVSMMFVYAEKLYDLIFNFNNAGKGEH